MSRVLLKLSGEALAGDKHTGFDEATVDMVASEAAEIVKGGNQLAIVIGGGNFWRGRTSENMDRVKADQIGMLATVMNCIYTADMMRRHGLKTSIYTPFSCGTFTKLFSRDQAIEDLERGVVCFFAGGTGHPYFSTDTGTVLRAIEIKADMILLAKNIDGVYNADPAKDPNAVRYDKISISEVVEQGLQVIDMSASILAKENKVPMKVFALNEKDGIIKALGDDFNGTLITM